jgi:Uma2 family endonuclease
MQTLELTPDTDQPVRELTPKYAGLRLTKAEFVTARLDDVFVYEFNDGILEPTRSMQQKEERILSCIESYFDQTAAARTGGKLRAEVDVWLTDKQMRRPDIAYYTAEQRRQMGNGERVIPSFVIEIVSDNDDTIKDVRKVKEYFETGVSVVWWVLPQLEMVYVYTSAKASLIGFGTDSLSAAPAIPDLTLTVEALFHS